MAQVRFVLSSLISAFLWLLLVVGVQAWDWFMSDPSSMTLSSWGDFLSGILRWATGGMAVLFATALLVHWVFQRLPNWLKGWKFLTFPLIWMPFASVGGLVILLVYLMVTDGFLVEPQRHLKCMWEILPDLILHGLWLAYLVAILSQWFAKLLLGKAKTIEGGDKDRPMARPRWKMGVKGRVALISVILLGLWPLSVHTRNKIKERRMLDCHMNQRNASCTLRSYAGIHEIRNDTPLTEEEVKKVFEFHGEPVPNCPHGGKFTFVKWHATVDPQTSVCEGSVKCSIPDHQPKGDEALYW